MAKPGSAEEACQSSETFSLWTEELLSLENAAEDEETTELLMTCTHSELQARGIAILKLAVSEQTTALYGRACLTLERPGGQPLPNHRITHGDIVGLFDQGTRPLSKVTPLASAVVQRVRPTSISLAFDGDVPVEVLDGRQLHLAAVSSDVTMKRYREVLDTLKSGKSDGPSAGLLSVCFDSSQKPRFREAKSETCSRPDAVDCEFRARESSALNEPQQAAVVKSLCAVDMAIIHGPPGTGKTTTLVAYILEAAYRKQRLLVTAPSNVAVDNLLERVLDCGFKSVVRLGHPARVQAELHRYTMDNVVYTSDQAALCRDIKKDIDDALKKGGKKGKDEAKRSYNEVNALRKELKQRERRAVAEVLRHTQVVFATCAGAATLHREIKKKGADPTIGKFEDFDVVIIDEAAQALEVACWIPMLLGPKAVLAGDHQQLAATVKSAEAQRRGFDRTLFARMIERHGDDVAALLSIQYRMNETIMGWSSHAFYSARLTAAESVAHRTLDLQEVASENLVGPTLEAMRAPLLFVDTGGLALYREDGADDARELDAGKRRAGAAVHQSRGNGGEARFLVHYAKLLLKAGLKPRDLTVISPYNKQVELLRNTFAEDPDCQRLGIEKPRVNTVDSFQGQEADAVLISLVRSNERGIVGFLSDYRRLNVAVTRARKHVMLVGDAATICSDKTLGSLYDYACENGHVVFVEQLLSEDGTVPPDPSAVQEPKRPLKVEKKLKDDKAKREQDAKREEKLRQQFEERLKPLLEGGGRVEFPPSLNPFERALAHEVATALGLHHESVGEGMQRRLCVWAPGHDKPVTSKADAEATAGAMATSAAGPSKTKAVDGSAENSAAAKDSDSDEETPLQAFERRAAATIAGLGSAGQPAAEWKAPSSVELEILERLAGEAGCELSIIGSGKKRRCRVETAEAPAAAATPSAAPAAKESAAEQKGSDSGSAAAAPAAGASNSLLADLHASRVQRKADEAEERRKQNEAARAELKQGKKSGKQKVIIKNGGYPAEEEDFDALLSEVASKDGLCAFGNCREKVNMMVDTLSLCRHCNSRFCLKHLQAECHGCGEAAKRAETKKWRDGCEAAMNPRGAGLANKSVGSGGRSQLAGKLQEKINQSEASRSTKKKDKKK